MTGDGAPGKTITQTDFNRIALFVAVAGELRMEPFVSDDNHERLSGSQDGPFFAHFCHPAFLKSALVPFRKLWRGSTELCAFEKVRDLIFEKHPDGTKIEPYRVFDYDMYNRKLTTPLYDWAQESTAEILDMWIYTQGIHSGQREDKHQKIINAKEPTLAVFEQWAQRIGREKFEYLFRAGLRIVGSVYVQFLNTIVEPLFFRLKAEGMEPGFEAKTALQYSPYPDVRYRITFDDVFWHLDKESMEETFDRLLDRQSYSAVRSLLQAFFPGNRPTALAAVCEGADFQAFMEANGATVLEDGDEHVAGLEFRGASGSSGLLGPVGFRAYEGRRLQFYQGDQNILAQIYMDFRNCLLEERKKQRPRKWRSW